MSLPRVSAQMTNLRYVNEKGCCEGFGVDFFQF